MNAEQPKLKGIIRKKRYVSEYWIEVANQKYHCNFLFLERIDPTKLAYEYEGMNCEFQSYKTLRKKGFDGVVAENSLRIINLQN